MALPSTPPPSGIAQSKNALHSWGPRTGGGYKLLLSVVVVIEQALLTATPVRVSMSRRHCCHILVLECPC